MQVGDIFELNGTRFAIKKIIESDNRVDASKMIMGKDGVDVPQRGRPSKFLLSDIAKIMGEEIEQGYAGQENYGFVNVPIDIEDEDLDAVDKEWLGLDRESVEEIIGNLE